jgi:Transposase IS116/IS110/IS902 family
VDLALVDGDEPRRADVERAIEKTAHGHAPVSLARLRTNPGVGNILALVRRDAIEESTRFPRGQACVSSCRLVKRARESTGKRHGPSGTTIGKAHRTWAFAEAAGLVLEHNEPAQHDLTQMATRHGQGQALSILARKLGRAVSGPAQASRGVQPRDVSGALGREGTDHPGSSREPTGPATYHRRSAPSDQARRTCARPRGAGAARQSRPPGALIGKPFRASRVQPRADQPRSRCCPFPEPDLPGRYARMPSQRR